MTMTATSPAIDLEAVKASYDLYHSWRIVSLIYGIPACTLKAHAENPAMQWHTGLSGNKKAVECRERRGTIEKGVRIGGGIILVPCYEWFRAYRDDKYPSRRRVIRGEDGCPMNFETVGDAREYFKEKHG